MDELLLCIGIYAEIVGLAEIVTAMTILIYFYFAELVYLRLAHLFTNFLQLRTHVYLNLIYY